MNTPAYPFIKPVFIVAAPRSGSTLLFETLEQAPGLWSIGGESHEIFESISALRPGQGVSSNRLTAKEAVPSVITSLHKNFIELLRNRDGICYNTDTAEHSPAQMLEKTPKNALRISFLNVAFPDSLFIYLYRDPCENISSIMEAWRSGRFVTYQNLPGMKQAWSMLLPPNWPAIQEKPLEFIAAHQWKSANQFILEDLKKLPAHRWTAITYQSLLDKPEMEIQRLCEFIGIPMDEHLRSVTRGTLPISRYTLTKPHKEKWRNNIIQLQNVLPSLEGFRTRTERLIAQKTGQKYFKIRTTDVDVKNTLGPEKPGGALNAPCPCGSGKKYKRCHGKAS